MAEKIGIDGNGDPTFKTGKVDVDNVGAQGPVGPQGLPGANGTNGTDGANGAKGDTGDKGDKGDTGNTGATGPAGSSSHSVLTYAASVEIDFTSTDDYRSLSLTGDVIFTTANRAAPRTRTIRILSDGSIRNFTFPAWIFVGGSAPTSIAANKTGILSVTAFGANDTDIVAAYAVES